MARDIETRAQGVITPAGADASVPEPKTKSALLPLSVREQGIINRTCEDHPSRIFQAREAEEAAVQRVKDRFQKPTMWDRLLGSPSETKKDFEVKRVRAAMRNIGERATLEEVWKQSTGQDGSNDRGR